MKGHLSTILNEEKSKCKVLNCQSMSPETIQLRTFKRKRYSHSIVNAYFLEDKVRVYLGVWKGIALKNAVSFFRLALVFTFGQPLIKFQQ